jgi:hypothetical protein
MATKKQRSRRAKTFRHEYALVKYDEEGNEIEISASELRGKSPDEKEAPKATVNGAAKPASRRAGAPQPPSWERALKRGGVMGLVLATLLTFVLHGSPVLAIIYAVMFVPLTYWMDGMTYRMYEKRQAGKAAKTPPPAGAPGSRGRKR